MRIKIASDFVCPWCFIGWTRLQRALAQRPKLTADIQWLPFQLNPAMPFDGMDRRAYVMRKFGDAERGRSLYDSASRAARIEGLSLALDRIHRMPSTLLAHALLRRLPPGPAATGFAESLFRAFLSDAQDISRVEVLLPLARQAGVPVPDLDLADDDPGSNDALEAALATEIAAVQTTDSQLRALSVQAIPCYIFDGIFVIPGAQEPRAFLPILDVLSAEAQARREAAAGPDRERSA